MEKRDSREKVAVVRYDGTFNSFAKALEMCDGLSNLKTSDKVLIKPNILWGGLKSWPQFGRVTTSVMVDYTLRALRDRGCSDITVGEGTIPNKEFDSTTTRGYKWTGIDKVVKKYDAQLIDFNSEPFEVVELEDVKARICTAALECDFLIDLPVLKAHRQTKVSLGMKNLKGCLALQSKQMFHKIDLNHLIASLNMKIQPSLTIIDGIYGLEKGPDFLGTPYRMDVIVAGKDVFSCDIVGSKIMGIEPDEVEYLQLFASMTGRSLSLDGIEVAGESIDQVSRKMEWRLLVQDLFNQAHISGITIGQEDTSCCSGCMSILSALTATLTKDSPNTFLDGVEICMGRGMKPGSESKKVFLLGDCAIAANKDRKDAIPVAGCPPPIVNSIMSIVSQSFPRRKAAKVLMSRMVKQVGTKCGIYHEAFPAFGVCEPPEFDKNHF